MCSPTRSATMGVEYRFPDRRPVCSMTDAYQCRLPARRSITGLRRYLFEVRINLRNDGDQVSGVIPIPDHNAEPPCRDSRYNRSMIVTFAVPPPSHMVCRP